MPTPHVDARGYVEGVLRAMEEVEKRGSKDREIEPPGDPVGGGQDRRGKMNKRMGSFGVRAVGRLIWSYLCMKRSFTWRRHAGLAGEPGAAEDTNQQQQPYRDNPDIALPPIHLLSLYRCK